MGMRVRVRMGVGMRMSMGIIRRISLRASGSGENTNNEAKYQQKQDEIEENLENQRLREKINNKEEGG